MRRAVLASLATVSAAVLLSACAGADSSATGPGRYEVVGVEEDDLLKLRAGPGIGYNVLLGLPNGTTMRVYNCQPTGGTRWCNVTVEGARGVSGHVSAAYIRRL